MSFNPDLNKKAQEVIFSMTVTKSLHSQTCFNNEKLNSYYHILVRMSKSMQGIDVIRKLCKLLNIFSLHHL